MNATVNAATCTVKDRPVVVGVADPDHIDAALRYAAAEAATHMCGIHLLSATGATGRSTDPVRARDVLEQALARARAVVGERTPVSSELFHGSATRALDAAGPHARLVVLQRGDHAARSAADPRPAWEQLAARSTAPVVVVPDLWSDRTPPGSVVTLGMDAPRQPALVREAVALAQARAATLQVVHAWWSPVFCAGLGVNDERARRWRSEAAAGLAVTRLLSGSARGLDVRFDVRHGRPAEVLANASRSSCLVVVGRGRALHPGAGRALGPVTTALVHDAACPVMLVPSRAEVWTAERAVTEDQPVRRVKEPA